MHSKTSSGSKKKDFKKSKVKRLKFKHCGRNIFFISNIIFMLVGVAFLCAGLTIVSKAPSVSKTDKIHAFIGTCDTTLGVLGITTIFKRNYIVVLFLALLIMMIPLHIGFGVEALLKIKDEKHYERAIAEAFYIIQLKISRNDSQAAYEMDIIQYHFACCGIDGYEDYKRHYPYLPRSCCNDYPNYCEIGKKPIFERGCKNVVLHFTYIKRKITGISLLLLLIPLLAVTTIGLNLAGKIHKETDSER